MSRNFKATLYGKEDFFGNYKSNTPSGAASKAFTQYVRQKGGKAVSTKISVVETTQGSGKKTFSYNCKRIKLKKPVVSTVQSGGGRNKKTVEIKREYKNIVKAYKK